MELAQDSGDRMDTMGGGDDLDDGHYGMGGLNEDDKLEVNLDDIQDDEESDGEAVDLSGKPLTNPAKPVETTT